MNDTQLIEAYLLNRLAADERLLVEARLLLDSEFSNTLKWQRSTYDVVKVYGRTALKQEIRAVEKRLFSESCFKNFRISIANIFK